MIEYKIEDNAAHIKKIARSAAKKLSNLNYESVEIAEEEIYLQIARCRSTGTKVNNNILYRRAISAIRYYWQKTNKTNNYEDIDQARSLSNSDDSCLGINEEAFAMVEEALTEEEKMLIGHRFGVFNYPRMSLKNMYKKYSISKDQLSASTQAAIDKLRSELQCRIDKLYEDN